MNGASIHRRCGPRRVEITSISAIADKFELRGTDYAADVFGSGHIHDTFLLSSPGDATGQRHILQQINRNVFGQPVQLMENIGRVIRHVGKKLQQQGDSADRCLSLVRTRDGDDFFRTLKERVGLRPESPDRTGGAGALMQRPAPLQGQSLSLSLSSSSSASMPATT